MTMMTTWMTVTQQQPKPHPQRKLLLKRHLLKKRLLKKRLPKRRPPRTATRRKPWHPDKFEKPGLAPAFFISPDFFALIPDTHRFNMPL